MSNYDIAKEAAAKRFLGYPTQKMIERLSLRSDEAYLYLDFVSTPFRVDRRTGLCAYLDGEAGFREADHNAAMTIYDILCYSQEPIVPSGEFVPMERLASTQNAASYAGKGMFSGYEKLFDNRDAALAAACRALGGTERGKGDVSYEIPVFAGVSVLLSFWNADEDFPPSLRMYCDREVLRTMHYETLWYMTSYVLERLRGQMEPPSERGRAG